MRESALGGHWQAALRFLEDLFGHGLQLSVVGQGFEAPADFGGDDSGVCGEEQGDLRAVARP